VTPRAPAGFWGCLGASGRWHPPPAAQFPADGPIKGQTACGLWPSLVIDLARRRTTPTLPLADTPTLCPGCAAQQRALRGRDRLVTPPAEQPRLF
jgi:hypothetical protein